MDITITARGESTDAESNSREAAAASGAKGFDPYSILESSAGGDPSARLWVRKMRLPPDSVYRVFLNIKGGILNVGMSPALDVLL